MSIEAIYALSMTAVALACIAGVALWEWWEVYRCQRCRTCGHPRYQHTGVPTHVPCACCFGGNFER